jgi:hypothetical protein
MRNMMMIMIRAGHAGSGGFPWATSWDGEERQTPIRALGKGGKPPRDPTCTVDYKYFRHPLGGREAQAQALDCTVRIHPPRRRTMLCSFSIQDIRIRMSRPSQPASQPASQPSFNSFLWWRGRDAVTVKPLGRSGGPGFRGNG